jgi:hypothetical protein
MPIRPVHVGLFPGAAQMTCCHLKEAWQAAERMGFASAFRSRRA